MTERMTRKELTERVRELSQGYGILLTRVSYIERCLATIDERLSKKTTLLGEALGLIEAHLGVIVTEIEAVPSKLVLKKVPAKKL